MKIKTLVFPLLFIAGIFCFSGIAANAQDIPGKRDSINSAILKEKRIISVVLPRNFKAGSNQKYDVLYVLDGDGNTKTATGVQQFIEDEAFMPPIIIVGVLNTDRNRDLTPTHMGDNKTSGGADKFLGFLKNELIPYVNKNYPSNGDNTLFGHSFGGLFVTYVLFNDPGLFKSYIAADPSYWWDSNYMNKIAPTKLPLLAGFNKTLYISGREGQPYAGMGIVAMDTLLKKYAPPSLLWKDLAYPDETHGSVRLKSLYDGLKFTYGGFTDKGPEFYPSNGIIVAGKPIKIWHYADPSRVRYTTDGTEPTLASAPLKEEITLSVPGKITAKVFSNRERYNKTTTGEFKAGAYLPPATKPDNMKPGGFNYSYYEGNWDKLPDFNKLKPIKTGITDSSFNIDKMPQQNNFALLVTGQLEVKQDGYYVFVLNSDDGSKLYLADKLLIDDDGLHGDSDTKAFIVPLQKGFYSLRLEYFQRDGGRTLRLTYLTPFTMPFKNSSFIPLWLQWGVK